MASYWVWTLILGAIITAGGALASRLSGGPPAPRLRLRALPALLGALAPIIAYLLCLPSAFPFGQGTAMGHGALLGLAAALLALACLTWARIGRTLSGHIAGLASLGGVAVTWVAATHLIFAGDPVYALYGGVAGALLAVLPWVWDLRRQGDPAAGSALEFFGLVMLIQGLGALLAMERYDSALLRPYWALPSLALAGVMLGAVVSALVLKSVRETAVIWIAPLLTIAVAFGVWVGGEALLAAGLHGHGIPRPFKFDHSLYRLLLAGWAGFGLLFVLARAGVDRYGMRMTGLVLGVALLIIAFNLGGGFGAAVALSAGLGVALPLWSARPRGPSTSSTASTGQASSGQAGSVPLSESRGGDSPFTWLATLGALYLAYRLFLADFWDQFRYDTLLEFSRHYAFVGLVAGVLWMAAARPSSSEERPRGAFAFLHAAAMVLLPVVLFVVFHYRALLGLILGLFVGQLVLAAFEGGEARLRGPSPTRSGEFIALHAAHPIFFPLVAVWALIIPRWGDFMLDLPRWGRGLIIAVVAVIAMLALALLRERAGPAGRGAAAPEEQ